MLHNKIWELPDWLVCHFLQKPSKIWLFWRDFAKRQTCTAAILLSFMEIISYSFRSHFIHTISKWNSQFQITVGNWAAETSWDLSFFAHLLESLTEVWEMLMLFGVQTFCGSFDCLLSLFHRHKFPQLCLHCRAIPLTKTRF